MVSKGAAVIAKTLAFGERDPYLECAVFATADPAHIAEAVCAFCQTHLGASVAHYEFFASSIGSVHGAASQTAVASSSRSIAPTPSPAT